MCAGLIILVARGDFLLFSFYSLITINYHDDKVLNFLFKYIRDKLHQTMLQYMYRMWNKDSLP